MNFITYFVTHKITTLMLFLFIMAVGLFAFISLPSSLLPDTGNNSISIIVRYPGQSPYKIEEIITKSLEDVISTIGGIEQIVSSSNDNEARIYITFNRETDIQFKAYEVHEKIEPVRALFPKDVNEPEIYLQGNDYSPVLVIGLSSTLYSLNRLRDIAEHTLKKQIERIEGVSQIEIGGGAKREIHIKIDNDYCIARNISFHSMSEKIQKNNFISSLGVLHDYMNDYTLRINSRLLTLENINNLPVSTIKSGSVTIIKDIANVTDFSGEIDSISRYNALQQVSLYIYKTSTANPIDVSQRITELVSQFSIPDVATHIVYNSAEEIKKALNNLYISCFTGIILTMLVVYIFLKNIKIIIPVIISIPFSLMAISIYLYFSGATLNVITLSGIAIATGMVVDNSIIVIEKIFSDSKYNATSDNCIISSTQQVAKALYASSLTTIVIFIPVLLLKSKSTALFIQLATTVIIAIAASLIVAIIFVPWCIHILTPLHASFFSQQHVLINKVRYMLTTYIALPTLSRHKYWNTPLSYCSIIEYFFNNKKVLYIIMIFFVISSIVPLTKIKYKDIIFTDEYKIFAHLEMPSGSSLQATSQAALYIEEQLQNIKSVINFSTRIEQEHADFIIETDKKFESDWLKTHIKPPADTSLIFTHTAGNINNEIEIIIKGKDIHSIRQICYNFVEKLQESSSTDDIIYHFKDDRPEIVILFDRNKCSYSGIPVAYAGEYIRSLLYGPVITKFIDDREVDVRIKNKFPVTISDEIANFCIPYKRNTIPLKNIATITTKTTVHTIWHHDKMRAETISIIPKVSMSTMEKILHNTLQQLSIPEGYYIECGNTFLQQKKSITYMIIYMCIAITLVYMVIASIFESLTLPFIIIISIPIAWIWAIWALCIFHLQCNIATIMGFVVLTGIVVNNSILLIDSYLQKIKNSKIKKPLVFKDYQVINQQRIKPMLITTITTVSGLLPLVISSSGSNLWQGFAITIISGLIGSLFCIVIITPVLFNNYQKYFHHDK